jgi:hypothetical protein
MAPDLFFLRTRWRKALSCQNEAACLALIPDTPVGMTGFGEKSLIALALTHHLEKVAHALVDAGFQGSEEVFLTGVECGASTGLMQTLFEQLKPGMEEYYRGNRKVTHEHPAWRSDLLQTAMQKALSFHRPDMIGVLRNLFPGVECDVTTLNVAHHPDMVDAIANAGFEYDPDTFFQILGYWSSYRQAPAEVLLATARQMKGWTDHDLLNVFAAELLPHAVRAMIETGTDPNGLGRLSPAPGHDSQNVFYNRVHQPRKGFPDTVLPALFEHAALPLMGLLVSDSFQKHTFDPACLETFSALVDGGTDFYQPFHGKLLIEALLVHPLWTMAGGWWPWHQPQKSDKESWISGFKGLMVILMKALPELSDRCPGLLHKVCSMAPGIWTPIVVEQLIEAGFDPERRNPEGLTPFQSLCQTPTPRDMEKTMTRIGKILCPRISRMRKVLRQQSFATAALFHNLALAQRLMTPAPEPGLLAAMLEKAAEDGHAQWFEQGFSKLEPRIDPGSLVVHANRFLQRALHHGRPHLDIVRALLSKGANPDVAREPTPDNPSSTALCGLIQQLALYVEGQESGQWELYTELPDNWADLCQTLLDFGASLLTGDKGGQSVLDILHVKQQGYSCMDILEQDPSYSTYLALVQTMQVIEQQQRLARVLPDSPDPSFFAKRGRL